MISAGDNTLRVAGHRTGPNGLYDVYQFTLQNLSGEVYDIAYAVPAGTIWKPRIIRDLLELQRLKLWARFYLKEVNGKLAIMTIKEPNGCQDELNDLFSKKQLVRLN